MSAQENRKGVFRAVFHSPRSSGYKNENPLGNYLFTRIQGIFAEPAPRELFSLVKSCRYFEATVAMLHEGQTSPSVGSRTWYCQDCYTVLNRNTQMQDTKVLDHGGLCHGSRNNSNDARQYVDMGGGC